MSAPALGTRYRVELDGPADFDGFRAAARVLTAHRIDPRDVEWQTGEAPAELFGDALSVETLPPPDAVRLPRVPKAFPSLAELVVCHTSGDRFALLHRLLVRLQEDPQLLKIASDEDVSRAERLAKNVRRCSHKMKAFVRFRAAADPDGEERYIAWFEPEHHTLELTAPFFVRRFATMRWSILTPERCAHWDGRTLSFGEGASRDLAPDGDVNEALWRTYFGAIFNPARLKVKAMQSEMPKRYWKNMPEGEMIAPLIKDAVGRTATMIATPPRSAALSTRVGREREVERNRMAELAEAPQTLSELHAAAAHCERCPLHGPATQVVVGEGSVDAAIFFVGEQPGDQEDLAGRPFVGPAGQLFDRALKDAGIERETTFVTNAVKHFKFEPRGKRRIHQKPNVSEIDHCRFWLDWERRLVKPRLTVALGATAVRALSGRSLAITKIRGEALEWADGAAGFATVHPSFLLRLPDEARKRIEYDSFVRDLARAGELAAAVALQH